MVTHVVETLARTVDEVSVVTRADLDLPPLDAHVVVDRHPDLGAVAGLRGGLEAADCGLASAAGVDAPHLTDGSVETMLSVGAAAAPVADGWVQTLAAVYPVAGAETADRLLAAGERRPVRLLESLEYRRVEATALPCRAWEGFNTPVEYLRLARIEFPGASLVVELAGGTRVQTGLDRIELPIGTLADVLRALPHGKSLLEGDRVAAPFLVSLDGRHLSRDATVPIGPGERVLIFDAQSGG